MHPHVLLSLSLSLLPTALTSAIPAAAPALNLALAPTATAPPKGACTIHSVAVDTSGSGCRPGTVGVAISSDNSIMTFIFDEFEAAIGPRAGDTSKRALCKVNITLSSPGWAFDIGSVDFRGYVNLQSGVEASIVSRWKWVDLKTGTDLKGKGNIQKKLQGPFDEDILLQKSGELGENEPSICQKSQARFAVTISASLSSSVTTAEGFVKGDSLDTKFVEEMGLRWRKC